MVKLIALCTSCGEGESKQDKTTADCKNDGDEHEAVDGNEQGDTETNNKTQGPPKYNLDAYNTSSNYKNKVSYVK